MTTAADDSAVEEAFEAYLAGRAVPAEGADLAAFAGAVRATAIQPGRPNAALAELLATGLLVDQPPLSVRTAKRRRRRMWFFSVIFAKIASAGAIAQAATGAGIVLVGFTGVGAAGALPTPVQHTFATVVGSITPLTAPDGSGTPAATTDPAATTTPATSTAPATETGQATETSHAADPTATTGGAAATTSAPKNYGQVVSSLAHERNAARKSAHKDDKDGSDASSTAAPTSAQSGTSDGESSDDNGDHTSGGQDSGHSSDQKSGHQGD
jgi:hypothetical protein